MKPLRVNGIVIPWALFVPAIMGIVWLAGLSFQVNANDSEIQKQAQTPVRLATMELNLVANTKAIEELKKDAKLAADSQSKKLDRILDKLE